VSSCQAPEYVIDPLGGFPHEVSGEDRAAVPTQVRHHILYLEVGVQPTREVEGDVDNTAAGVGTVEHQQDTAHRGTISAPGEMEDLARICHWFGPRSCRRQRV